jgi:xylulokinase
MHGVVMTDKSGQPLYPTILWADTRSATILSHYHALAPELQHQLANPITTGMAGPTALWVKHHPPELYAIAQHLFQPKDWLRFQLTGAIASDPSDASGTLLYDVQRDRWADEVFAALALRSDWLPPLIPSTQVAGSLTPAAAVHLGLPTGIPVVGAADTAAAALGGGLTSIAAPCPSSGIV